MHPDASRCLLTRHDTAAALSAATCNARDFYPQGAAAWQQARDERAEMFRKLAEVQAYAEAWMERASDHL